MSRRRNNQWEKLFRSILAFLLLAGIAVGASGGLGYSKSGLNAIIVIAFVALTVAFITFILWVTLKVFGLGKLLNGKTPSTNVTKRTVSCVTEPPPNQSIEDAIDKLDWFQLEQLVARLFEVKGCTAFSRGGAKADGGIDLVVQMDSSKAAVQCKHWSKWKCGPSVVRELIGSMVHENYSQGFLICRSATEEAKSLADSHRIRIIERAALINRIESAIERNDGPVINALFRPEKLCPKCGSGMILRTASKGKKPGEEFWGCSTYPKCHQVLKI